MTTVDDVLNLAISQIGTCENPIGSNSVKYNTWFYKRPVSGPAYPWCACFVSWIFNELNAKNLIHVFSAYSGDILHAGQAAGEEVTIAQAGPGDIVIFDYGDGGRTDHIAIVEKRLGPTTFQTIEGNIGDCVARKTRTRGSKCNMWFTRPKYAQSQPEKSKEDFMLYQGEGKEFIFEDCYVDKYTYWLHTRGDSENVTFTLLSHRTGEEKTSNGQKVSGHQDHDMQVVAATDKTKTDDSYTLTCKSASPIRWALREMPK